MVETLVEVSDLLMAATPFSCEIIEDGVMLRDRDSFYDHLRDLVEEAKMRDGLVRSAEGWQWTRIEIRKHCGSGTIAPQAEGQPWEANDDQRF